MQHQYLRDSGLSSGVKSWLTRWLLHRIRIWDARTAPGVDTFVCNSAFIGRRIAKVYGRNATVVHPPVDVDKFNLVETKENFYFTASRLVPYKRIDLIVRAFARMPDRRLVVVGDGPDAPKVRDAATPNVEYLGYQSDAVLRDLMSRARALVFAAEEDFGIIPVEAQACGTPVIAYGKGGSLETVVGEGAARTGVFFSEQTVESICDAVRRFEQLACSPADCRTNAERFSARRFREEMSAAVDASLRKHEDGRRARVRSVRKPVQ